MAIKAKGFVAAEATTPNLDAVTTEGNTTTNSITVGGVSIGTAYSLPTSDGAANQVLQTDGSGGVTFQTLDVTGGLEYKGSFNATAGTPSLANAEKGDFYVVDTAGTIYGQTWGVGDHLLINEDMGGTITNSKIDKIDNTDQVTSVNGQTGAVTLTASDVSALASGDNVSELTNDAGYLTSAPVTSVNTQTGAVTLTASDVSALASGDNVSELTNDAGYLTSAPVTSVNSLTGAVTLSGNDIAADHTATNYTAANANVDGHLSGIDTALGTALAPTLDSVTDNGATTTNDISVGGIISAGNIVSDADGTRTLGTEANRYITLFGDVNGAVRFKAKNDSGSAMTKGQVVYIKGISGTVPTVDLADADVSSKMPAFGLVYANANDQAEVQIVSFGNLTGLNTSSFSAGDTLYVSTTAGTLTATKPAGESAALQNIGRVVRSHASEGVVIVGGAGRSAATPNLDQNKLFLGNASNQAVSTALSSIALSSLNDDLSYLEPANNLSDVSNASTARTNLGLAIGSDVQAYDAQLADVAGLTPTDGNIIIGNGTNFITESGSTARESLGLGSISTQDSDNVTITGGDISGITTLSVAANGLTLGSTLVTATAAELNTLDGITATTAELNVLDGVTATTTELNLLDGVTATTSELNTLDGITATTAELNTLDGITATTAELNFLDTSAQSPSANDVLTYNGTTLAWSAQAGGSVALDGIDPGTGDATLATNGNITIDAQLSNSDIIFKGTDGGVDTTFVTIDGSDGGTIKANGDLRLEHDGAKIYFGADSDVYLDHQHNGGLRLDMGSPDGGEPKFTIHSSNSTSNGPSIILDHNPATGTSAQIVSELVTNGIDSGGGTHTYTRMRSVSSVATAGSEAGAYKFYVATGGTGAGFSGTEALVIEGDSGGNRTVNVVEHDGSSSGLELAGTLVTATAAELNTLDGITATTAELNFLDTSAQSPSANDVLTYNGTTLAWSAQSGGGSVALDGIDPGTGDATLATNGNITIDAQASDSDIIFKGTDGGVDTTFVTIDGSDGGTIIGNHDLELSTNGSEIRMGDDVTLRHVDNDGLEILIDSSEETNFDPSLKITATQAHTWGPRLFLRHTGSTNVNDAMGSVVFEGRNNNNVQKHFARIDGVKIDGTNNAEDGTLRLIARTNGSLLNNNGLLIQGDSGNVFVTVPGHDGSTNGLKLGSTLVTATAAELNTLDGITATTAELNVLDGVTATTTELNTLDGITASTTELNFLDTSAQSPSTNDVLTYNGTTLAWSAQAGGGGGGLTYSAITANTTAQADYHYSCTGSITLTLPTSGISAGSEIRVKNMGTGTITIDPQTGTIDGSTTDRTLTDQYSALILISTGTNWEII